MLRGKHPYNISYIICSKPKYMCTRVHSKLTHIAPCRCKLMPSGKVMNTKHELTTNILIMSRHCSRNLHTCRGCFIHAAGTKFLFYLSECQASLVAKTQFLPNLANKIGKLHFRTRVIANSQYQVLVLVSIA